MNRNGIILVVLIAFVLFGCGRKDEFYDDDLHTPLSIEALSNINASTSETKAAEPVSTAIEVKASSDVGIKLEPLPPPGPFKPSSQEIQTALKNAGYYPGEIDGKIGPVSRRAIEEFQKANALLVDGKVGLKTWAVLGPYLTPKVAEEPKKKKR